MAQRYFALPFLLIIFISLLSSSESSATHIMGGDLTYRHLKDSTYEIKFLIYRDKGEANIDNSISYNMYTRSNKAAVFTGRTVNLTRRRDAEPEAPNCVSPQGISIESGEYIDTITLGNDPRGYHIVWFRAERNYAITNLKRCSNSPSNTACSNTFFNCRLNDNRNPFGSVWHAEIPPRKFQNSSPQFLTVPIPYFCVNVTNYFNHLLFDPDGDSLAFSIAIPSSPAECSQSIAFPPITAPPFPTVVYKSGFSHLKPFGSSSKTISINPRSGEMKAEPDSVGNYVIAVQIREFRVDPITRKATYLGQIRRDLQFIAGNCPSNRAPTWTELPTNSLNFYEVGDTIELTFEGTDPGTDTVNLKALGSIFGTDPSFPQPWATFQESSDRKTVKQTLKWIPTCDHITYSGTPHSFSVILSDAGCNEIQRTYSIFIRPKTILDPPKLRCLNVQSNGDVELKWDTISRDIDFVRYNIYRKANNGSMTRIASVTDNTDSIYVDKSLRPDSLSYTYYMKTENSCSFEGAASDSLRTILLSYTESNDKAATLRWTSYNFSDTLTYFVEKKQGNAFVHVDTVDRGTSFNLTGCNIKGTYRIHLPKDTTFGSPYGCDIYSNELVVNTEDTTSATQAAILGAQVVSNSQIALEFDPSGSGDIGSYRLEVQRNGGTWTSSGTTNHNSSSSYRINHNATHNSANKYCLSVRTIDNCGNVGQRSSRHCLAALSVTGDHLSSQLNWDSYDGFELDSQIVQRYHNGSWVSIDTLNGTDTAYKDADSIICNETYSYRIISLEKGGNDFESFSDSTGGTAIDTVKPAAPQVVFTTVVSADSVQLLWNNSSSDDADRYIVRMRTGQGGYVNLDTLQRQGTGRQSYFAKGLNTGNNQYSFSVAALDSCQDNLSDTGNYHSPVRLTGSPGNKENFLRWFAYDGFNNYKYTVQNLGTNGWADIGNLTSADTSFDHTSLACNISQEYRIKTISADGVGDTSYSNRVILTPFDTTKPASPAIQVSTVKNADTIVVRWAQSSAADVTRYILQVSTNGGIYTTVDTVSKQTGSTQAYEFGGVSPANNLYRYRVIALDSCANNASPNNRPHRPVRLTGTQGNKSNQLNWFDYEGFGTIKEYVLQSQGSNGWSAVATVRATDTSYNHTNLPCNVTQRYRLMTVEDANPADTSYSNEISLTPFDTVSPTPPVIQSVNVLNDSTVELKWAASVDDDVTRYIVYREGSTGLITLDTLYKALSYQDKIDARDGSLCYTIKAIDSCANNTSFRNSAKHCTMRLTAEPVGCEWKIKLDWNEYQNLPGDVLRYEVYRRVDGGAEKRIVSTTKSRTDFEDNNVSAYHDYSYRIKVIEDNNGSNFSYSSVDTAITFRIPSPVIAQASKTSTSTSTGTVEVSWADQSGLQHIKSHKLYYKNSASASFNLLQDDIKVGTNSFTHNNLNTKSGEHYYFLVSEDSCDHISDTLDAHKTMDFEFNIGQLEHSLSWTAYEGFTIEDYILQQEIGGTWQNQDTLPASATSFNKIPAPCNTQVRYRIAAVSDLGAISYSDTAINQAIDIQSPNAPTLMNVTASGDTAHVIEFTGADSLDIYGYSVDRSRQGGTFFQAGLVPFSTPKFGHSYMHKSATNNGPFCYTVVSLDSCLNFAASDTFCPLFLTVAAGNYEASLKWTAFKGYDLRALEVQRLDNGSWNTLGTLNGDDSLYTDKSLACNVSQRYRVQGIEDNGTRITFSNEVSVTPFDTTVPVQPVIASVSVLNGSAELTWDYDNNSDIKDYEIYRQQGSAGFQLLSTVSYTGSFQDAGPLDKSSIYQYYVVAIDSCGNAPSPNSATHNTMRLELKKDSCDPTSYLNWTRYEGFSRLDSYYVHQISPASSTTLRLAGNGADTSYDDKNVLNNQRYCYRIEAVNGAGNSASLSDSVCFLQSVIERPVAPTLLYTTVDSTDLVDGKISITWSKSPFDQTRVIGYRVYQVNNGTPDVLVRNSPRGDTTFTLTPFNTKGDTISFKVLAYNTCGFFGDSSTLHKPVQLRAQTFGNLRTKLSWSAYKGFNGVIYEVWRAPLEAGKRPVYSLLETLTDGSQEFTDSNVLCNTDFVYRITSINAANRNIESWSDVEVITGKDSIAPVVTQLQHTTYNPLNNTLSLRWEKSSEADIESAIIDRSTDNSSWSNTATVGNGEAYLDRTIDPLSGPFYYRIRLRDTCGNESASFSESHRSIVAKLEAKDEVNTVSWNAYKERNVTQYNVKRSDGESFTLSYPQSTDWDTTLSYQDSAIDCGDEFYYWIEAVLKDGSVDTLARSTNTDSVKSIDETAPTAPTLLQASVIDPNVQVELTWEKEPSFDLAGYRILRSEGLTEANAEQDLIDDAEATDAVNSIELNKDPFCYSLQAFDECDNRSDEGNKICIMLPEINPKEKANELSWDKYTGKADDLGYVIYRSEDSQTWTEMGTSSEPFFADEDVEASLERYCYLIEAIDKANGDEVISRSAVSCVEGKPLIWIPNAFSPGISADINDFFYPVGAFIKTYSMLITSRTGQIIYFTDRGEPWSGLSITGEPLPYGQYHYKIVVEGFNGEKQEFKGSVSIIW